MSTKLVLCFLLSTLPLTARGGDPIQMFVSAFPTPAPESDLRFLHGLASTFALGTGLSLGAYAGYMSSSALFFGKVTEQATSTTASFTESDSIHWFSVGIRLGFRIGSKSQGTDLPRTIAQQDTPAQAPAIALPEVQRAPASSEPEQAANAKERLQNLKDLKDQGLIDAKEYSSKRREIIEGL